MFSWFRNFVAKGGGDVQLFDVLSFIYTGRMAVLNLP